MYEVPKGFLICFDGTDGSGKQTQAELLYQAMKKFDILTNYNHSVVKAICEGKIKLKAQFVPPEVERFFYSLSRVEYEDVQNALFMSFPNYSAESSTLVRSYLNGDYAEDPTKLKAEAIANFYAVDRFDSWHGYPTNDASYNTGAVVICDRWTPSNILYQGAIEMIKARRDFNAADPYTLKKLEENFFYDRIGEREINYMRNRYVTLGTHIADMEYRIFNLPKPTYTIFLQMDRKHSEKNIQNRETLDILDRSSTINEIVARLAGLVSPFNKFSDLDKEFGDMFITIKCQDEDGNLRSIEEIHDEIYYEVGKRIHDQVGEWNQKFEEFIKYYTNATALGYYK